jgi:hypothetical protein
MKTFFDPGFDPGIMLGPVALDFLHDHFTRYNRSIDAVTTILQVFFYPIDGNDVIDLVPAGVHEAR